MRVCVETKISHAHFNARSSKEDYQKNVAPVYITVIKAYFL